jgi:riboflavin transporter FmnP
MATYTNISYVAKNVGTAASTLTTVGTATTAAIASLIVSNTTTSPITTSVYFTRSAVDYYLVYGATIPVGGSLEVIQGNRVVLIAADVLKVINSTASSGDCVASVLLAA